MMIDELFLYDRDEGLFKNILKQSLTIQGNYHVSPNYGQDLNTSNLETFYKDAVYGMQDVKKYPICVCMTPTSRGSEVNKQSWEEFFFDLFFLTTTKQTPDNQIRSIDPDTKLSMHHVWYDWSDMKSCASSFYQVLKKVIRQEAVLRTSVMLGENYIIKRQTRILNDSLSGVMLSFSMSLNVDGCELTDYNAEGIQSVEVPEFTIHQKHNP